MRATVPDGPRAVGGNARDAERIVTVRLCGSPFRLRVKGSKLHVSYERVQSYEGDSGCEEGPRGTRMSYAGLQTYQEAKSASERYSRSERR